MATTTTRTVNTKPRPENEKRRDYYREYRRKKRQEEKISPQIEKTEIVDSAKQIGIEPDSIKSFLGTVLSDSKASKDQKDRTLKYIDMGMKALPLVVNVLKQFSQGMADARGRQQPIQHAQPTIQPPDGWTGMSPLERYKRKLNPDGSESNWYKAGMRYEEFKETGSVAPAQIEHQPVHHPTPKPTVDKVEHYKNTLPQKQDNIYIGDDVDRELAAQKQSQTHATNDNPKDDNIPSAQTEQPVQSLHGDTQTTQATTEAEQMTPEQKFSAIQQALTEDVRQQINTAIQYIKNMEDTQLLEFLKDDAQSGLKQKITMYKSFLMPVQMRDSLAQSSTYDIVSMIASECPKQWELIQKEQKTAIIHALIDHLKS